MQHRFALAVAASPLLLAGMNGGAFAAALDANLFATYTVSKTSVQFDVCGALPEAFGCFGGGTLAPFQHACSVLESAAKTNGDVVSRKIYVLDRRSSSTAPAILFVYERTDTITASHDSIDVKLVQQVQLGILGGPGSKCSMAANANSVYASTGVNTSAAVIDKSTLTASLFGGGIERVTGITSDARGYISINFADAFYLIGPDGETKEDGGGNATMVETHNALNF